MSLQQLVYKENPGIFKGVIGELPNGSLGQVKEDYGKAAWLSDLNLRITKEISCDGNKEFTLSGTGANSGKSIEFTISSADAVRPTEFAVACTNAIDVKDRVGGLTFETVKHLTTLTGTKTRHLKRITAPMWSDKGVPLIPGLELDPDVEFQLGQYAPALVYNGDISKAKECLRHMLEYTKYSPILAMAYLAAPMVARWFKNDRFGIAIFGETQSFKTAAFMAFMCMYGVGYSEKSAILKAGKRNGTDNGASGAFEDAGFLPQPYDNVKTVSPPDVMAYIGLVQAVIEGAGKARRNKDTTARKSKEYASLPAITGEIKPPEAATSGRVLDMLWYKPTEDELVHLTYVQEHVADMPIIGYQWLLYLSKISAPDMEYFKEVRSKKFHELTTKHCVDAGRSSTTYAIFKVVWEMLKESVFGDVVTEFDDKFNTALDATIAHQNESVGDETEVERFMTGLRELIASQPAKFPKAEYFRKGTNYTDNIQERGGFIGVQYDDGVLVLPGPALKALKDMGIFVQIPSTQSMGQALAAKGYIKAQHGFMLKRRINAVPTSGWLITKGIFIDKLYRDIPAAQETE